jgi:signal transduction histidine kinase/sensor domain CHASE-containing protein
MKKLKVTFIYSVVFKVIIFTVALASLYIWMSLYGINSYQTQNQTLYNARRIKDISVFEALVNKNSESVAAFSQDYSIWDDMVTYIANPKKESQFAEINLTTDAMDTYNTDGLRVYNPAGDLVIGVDTIPDNTGDFVVPGRITELFSQSRTIHFYSKYKNTAMEVYGSTVHPSDDSQRETAIRGYLFSLKYIDQSYMDAVGSLVKNSINIIDPAQTNQYATEFKAQTGHVAFKYDLKDINDNTVAQFYVTDEIPAIKQTSNMQDHLMLMNYLLYGLTALAFLLLISRWVIRPLNRIIRGLNNNDHKSTYDLHKTSKAKSEYGRLARLVLEHKVQEKALEHEKKTIEHQVAERTEELQAEHSRLQASIESLKIGYFITDIHDRILMINQKAKELLQKSPDAGDPNQSLWTIQRVESVFKGIKFGDKLKHCREKRQAVDLEEVNFDHSILKIYITPIFSNNSKDAIIIGNVVLLEDITEKKVLERSRDEFFSIASHELRTPLTAIMGNAKMIIDYYSQKLNDQSLNEMVSDIHESSVRLINIVNEFLDVSRIEQGKMTFNMQYFDVTEVLEGVIYEMKHMLQSKNLYLRADDSMTHGTLSQVYADPARVKQILYNLIGNAVKFTETGGITISTETNDKFLKVLVTDSGSGISEESQDLLFHKFQRANDNVLTRDVANGTGLGLYISKLLVEKMGGVIKLESSQPGVGSTFSFSLPIHVASITSPRAVDLPDSAVNQKLNN